MREKLETLPMTELREIAKANGIKSVTVMRKSALIDRILEVTGGNTITSENTPKPHTERTYVPGPSRTYKKPVQKAAEPAQEASVPKAAHPHQHPQTSEPNTANESLDSGIMANGILEVMPDGFGFIRCDNYMPGDADVYVSPMQIKRLGLRTGDIIVGKVRVKTQNEKFAALLCVDSVNGYSIADVLKRNKFEDLTPVFPNSRLVMETDRHNMAMRILDIISPIGKGQRGMIVSPPKAGKTTLLKEMAQSITMNNPKIKMIILLIDERPEEVTDIKECIDGENVEVMYSTFDELP